jgi:hypothetical protein
VINALYGAITVDTEIDLEQSIQEHTPVDENRAEVPIVDSQFLI